MLIAATEQMKITELRLLKTLTAAQQKVTESAATSERRAGLVLNHLRGAQTLRMPICCQRSSRECTLHEFFCLAPLQVYNPDLALAYELQKHYNLSYLPLFVF